MKCSNCGAELLEGAKFCTVCGTPTAVQQVNAAAENTAEAVNTAAENAAGTVNAMAENVAGDASGAMNAAAPENAAGPVNMAPGNVTGPMNAAPGNNMNAMGGGMPLQYGPVQGPPMQGMYGAPPMPQKQKKKMSKGLRNGLIAVCCVAAAVIVVLVILNMLPTTVSLNQYVTITEDGYDGYGTASVNFDKEAFRRDYDGKIKVDKNAVRQDVSGMSALLGDYTEAVLSLDSPVDMLVDFFRGELDRSSGLKNGDEITYKWETDDEEAKKYFNVVFDCSDIKYTVSNLDPVETFDAFEGVDVVFDGIAPEGTAYIDTNNSYYYILNRDSGLSNGDSVTVTIDIGSPDSFIQQYGKIPETNTKTYMVEGLSSYITSLSELSDVNLAELQRVAEETVLSYGAGYYESTQNDVTYLGAYLLSRKDPDGFAWSFMNNMNYLYLVYTAVDVPTDGRYDPVLQYLPVEIYDVVVDGDGNVTYNYNDRIEGTVYEQLPNGYYYNSKGYIDPSLMYQEIVTSNSNYYKTDVSDEVMRF